MLRVVKQLARPYDKVKRSFLGVFELKMLQFFTFFCLFSNLLFGQSKIEFCKIDKGLFKQ